MGLSAQFNSIVKRYGDTTVIDQLNLNVREGEFFTLLGPSGCGKTTLLRMVAGFNTIDGGDILIDGNTINVIPAHKRNMGMVFQNYAIFPHMTVFDNVAYGLKARKIPKEDIEKEVTSILELMQISHLRDRFPQNISGGQQQRVALARAIVIKPTMLLMDEPLSNLDAKLRIEMRIAIKKIQQDTGITTIYVTHDQDEALAISDRIVVMNKGVIQQVDIPLQIYSRPSNSFVASFIGKSNIMSATRSDNVITLSDGYAITMDNLIDSETESEVRVAIRPEEFIIHRDLKQKGLRGKISFVVFLGRYVEYQVLLESGTVVECTQDVDDVSRFFTVNTEVVLEPNHAKINLFDASGENSLIKKD